MNDHEPYCVKRDRETAEWLRSMLDRPLSESDEWITADDFNPWELFPGIVSAYSSSLDELAISVLKAVRDRTTFEILEGPQGLAAELFMHMLADRLCTYGTSPRGVWPVHPVQPIWQELIDKWEAYAKVMWQ
jgi:hypothetical protein